MHTLLEDDGFWIALAVGLLGAGAVALLHRRIWFVHARFEAGAAATVAAIGALSVTDRRTSLSIIGVILVAIGGFVGHRLPGCWSAATAVPGAAVVALALHTSTPDWAALAGFVAISVAVPCTIAVDRGTPRLVPVLLAGSALGMWATTPDTEHTRVLAGAVLGTAVLFFDRRVRPGAAGVAALVATMCWAATLDGYPRRSALIGALACFGALVLLPLVRRTEIPLRLMPIAVVVAAQAAIVIFVSRVAGLRSSPDAAIALTGLAWLVGGAVLRFGVRPARR